MSEQLREISIPFRPAATAGRRDISVTTSRAGWSVDLTTQAQGEDGAGVAAMLLFLGDQLLDATYRRMSRESGERKSRARRAAFNKRARNADGAFRGRLLAGTNLVRWELSWDDVEDLQSAVTGEEHTNG